MTTDQVIAQDKMEKTIAKIIYDYAREHPEDNKLTFTHDGERLYVSRPTDNQPVKPNAR